MLEYWRPPPAPLDGWWGRRSYEIWQRRGEDWTPALAAGEEQPLAPGVGVRVFADATSFTVQLTLRLRSARPRPVYIDDGERPEALPDEFLRVGVRFADGRVATNLPGAFWTALDEGPVFLSGNHEYGDIADELPDSRTVYAVRWNVWPIPPPGPLTDLSREVCDPVAARIASAAGVESWHGDSFEPWVAAFEEARSAASGDEFGWFSPSPGAYELELTVVAATPAGAREQAERRLALPGHWSASIDAQPASSG